MSSATIAGSAFGCTSRRTTGSKRRCRSSSLDERALAHAVVVELDLRVAADPEQAARSRSPSPGRASRRWRAITWSRPTKTRAGELDPGADAQPLRQLARHLDAHQHRLAVTGSSSRNAHEVDRFETNGNGCAASRLSGVSTGEICVSNTRDASSRCSSREVVPVDEVDAVLGEARPDHVA